MVTRSAFQHSERKRGGPTSSAYFILPGLLPILSAALLALAIHYVHSVLPQRQEQAIQWVGVLFSTIIVASAGAYLAMHRRAADPRALGLIVLTTLGMLLVSIYLYWASLYVFFPADILLWSESDFVNDILKFQLAYPIYSPQENNESFVYTPGAQIVTYLVSWLLGGATSIPLWRTIQLGYVFLAVIVAVSCCHMLTNMGLSIKKLRHSTLWYALWLLILFLIATNSITNAYIYNLHNDALALLVSAIGYWLLLKYLSTREKYVLVLMAIVPTAGFLVKQNLAIWALLYCTYLVFFDRPRSVTRILTFSLFTFGGILAGIGACYLLWGEHFIYWVFIGMGKDPVSPLRSLQHALDAWIYFTIGLLGGFVLLRGKVARDLWGAWLTWLILILVEAYTSGVGWMLNHMGPGSLIAGIWFLTALTKSWPGAIFPGTIRFNPTLSIHTAIIVTIMSFSFSGLGFFRFPVKHLPDDVYRYVREIEREFEGLPAGEVLLDAGSWVYLNQGVIMKDRGIPFGNRGYNGTGDFSGMIKRLKEKYYAKILVRNLNSSIFLYDHWLWPKSSGIKQAMLENYRVNGTITPVKKNVHEQIPYLFFDEISILVPKQGG